MNPPKSAWRRHGNCSRPESRKLSAQLSLSLNPAASERAVADGVGGFREVGHSRAFFVETPRRCSQRGSIGNRLLRQQEDQGVRIKGSRYQGVWANPGFADIT